MTKFDKPIKIYLFKDKQKVSISFLVTPNYVTQYWLKQDEMEKFLGFNNGVEFECHCGNWWVIEYKRYGPKPDKKFGPYVRVSVTANSVTHHHRFSVEDFEDLCLEYAKQKSNKMYWDE